MITIIKKEEQEERWWEKMEWIMVNMGTLEGQVAPKLLPGCPLAILTLDPLVPSGLGGLVRLLKAAIQEWAEMGGLAEGVGGHIAEEEVVPHTPSPPPLSSRTPKALMLHS
jgi:hypothetical protein